MVANTKILRLLLESRGILNKAHLFRITLNAGQSSKFTHATASWVCEDTMTDVKVLSKFATFLLVDKLLYFSQST